MNKAVLALLLLASLAPSAAGLELRLHAMRAPGDWLVAELQASDLLDEELLRAIRSGLPARFRVDVELWRDRSRLWDHLESSARTELRVVFDPLEEEFRVFDGSGNAVLDTDDLEELASLLESDRLELGPLEDLDPRKDYYLVARLQIQPLSLEEIRDLERWLRGSVRDGGGVGGQILGLVRRQLGLGDRSAVVRGRSFRSAELPREGSPR